MTALLNWRVWAAVALVIALAASHWKAYHLGANTVQEAWDTAQASADRAARAKEQSLQAEADQLRKTQNDQLAKISRDLDAARAAIRLLHSTPRPANYTAPAPGAGAQCSGASLFTQDAEFLAGEAARADELRAAFERCEAQYNAVRSAMMPYILP